MEDKLAKLAVKDFIELMRANLPEELGISAYYDSEQSLQQVQGYPCIFVLCPYFEVVEWQPPDYIDNAYTMVIGAIVLEQDPTVIRGKLYDIVTAIITALIKPQQLNSSFDWTFHKQDSPMNADFGPIFTSIQEQFIADARVTTIVRRNKVEEI